MNGEPIILRPIGVIHSDHTVPERTPIQPVSDVDAQTARRRGTRESA